MQRSKRGRPLLLSEGSLLLSLQAKRNTTQIGDSGSKKVVRLFDHLIQAWTTWMIDELCRD